MTPTAGSRRPGGDDDARADRARERRDAEPPDALEDPGAVLDAEAIGGAFPDMDAAAAARAARFAAREERRRAAGRPTVTDGRDRFAPAGAPAAPAPGAPPAAVPGAPPASGAASPDGAPAAPPDEQDGAPDLPPAHQGVARNTAIFSVATGLSRIAGLAREIVAASLFGTSGAASAFTIAFQVPNLVRGLFADAALSAAFVPVFTEYLEHGKRREAILLASTLFWIILLVLGALSALFIVGAGVIMPLFIPGDEFTPSLVDLTVGLSQILFPVVVLLGINGLLVGIVNAYHHFTIPAISPLVWNLVIIGALVGLHGRFEGQDQIYAYAIGVLIGTVVQLLMVIPVLGRIDFRLRLHLDWRDPGVTRVLKLMLPVTIGLGVINVDLLINSVIGALISESAPRAIDAAFRVYMLPQGMFSVALATVLFPSLSRLVARGDTPGLRALLGTGIRQNLLLLVPAAAATMALAAPIVELIYQYGSFGPDSTDEVATALFWFSFSLPFAGVNLLLTRTFFSIQRPWIPTALAGVSLLVNLALSLALYGPLGIAGPVIGTAASGAVMFTLQSRFLRRDLGGSIEGRRTLSAALRILLASALLAAVSYGVWYALDGLVGDAGPLTRMVAVTPALVAGIAAYAVAVQALGVPEAAQIRAFVTGRLRRRSAAA